MDTPLEVFQYLYNSARRTLESDQAHAERQAYLKEKQTLDKQYKYELKQRRAIEERRITLAMASSASILMKLSDAQPEYWMYKEATYETQGWLKKKQVQTGTRTQISLEGWPLIDTAQDAQDIFENNSVLVLTADENINGHPPLVWYTDYGFSITKKAIHPLSATPLSFDDMPWRAPAQKSSSTYSFTPHDSKFIRAEPNEKEIERLKASSNFTSAHVIREANKLRSLEQARGNADYDTYKKMRIEKKIRQAIARVAAQHNVLSQQ